MSVPEERQPLSMAMIRRTILEKLDQIQPPARTNTSPMAEQIGLPTFHSMPSPADPQPKRKNKRKSKKAEIASGVLQFPNFPTSSLSAMSGLNFESNSMKQRTGDGADPVLMDLHMDNLQNVSRAMPFSDAYLSKPNSRMRRRKQNFNDLYIPASEALQFMPQQFIDENTGTVHPNNSVKVAVNKQQKLLTNLSLSDHSAPIQRAKPWNHDHTYFTQSSNSTANPRKSKQPKEIKVKHVGVSPEPKGRSRVSTTEASSADPEVNTSSTSTSDSSNASPILIASPENLNLSLKDITKSLNAITLERYDRRQHATVTSEEDHKRCQYAANYVCTNKITTPGTTHCMEHLLLAGKMDGLSLSRIKKSVPVCAFVFKSGGAEIPCRLPVSVIDPISERYCKSHEHEIRSMKEEMLKLSEGRDYLEVLRHGCNNLPNTTHADNQNKQDIPKKAEGSSQAENGQPKVGNSETKMPETNNQVRAPNSAEPNRSVMLETQKRFKVPGCEQMNNDDDGWLDYTTFTVEDYETLQLFQADSDDNNSEDDDELKGHEMLSTAGYHTAEELVRLLGEKQKALLELYQKHKQHSKEMYIMRRNLYWQQVEAAKTTKFVRSNPDMLPINEEFPPEFKANELIARQNVGHLVHKGNISGQLGLLIYKENEKAKASGNEDIVPDKRMGGSKLSSSLSFSVEPQPCSSRSIGGKPMIHFLPGNNNSVPNLSGNGKRKSDKSSSGKKLKKAKNSAKQTELRSDSPEVPTTTNRCAASCCIERPLPLTKYCLQHITQDKKQVMYAACGSLKTTSSATCKTPVMTIMEKNGCQIHFQEYLPDLPLSKEERYYIIAEEAKQMVLPDGEEKVVDDILFSQFEDLKHLEEELSAAVKSDYLDTNSESLETTDDEKRLPPFGDGTALLDSALESEDFGDSDETVSDDSYEIPSGDPDGVEFVKSDEDVLPFSGLERTDQSLTK